MGSEFTATDAAEVAWWLAVVAIYWVAKPNAPEEVNGKGAARKESKNTVQNAAAALPHAL